ncbi:MAG TPA: GGDEF domain-containing protein [Solirubrobacterales bacterium]|jgi:diguanylate cyclase (GGDEF)-like protein|nr:GGDEF domain-containing protein [Solirubrobacterales bacterium]
MPRKLLRANPIAVPLAAAYLLAYLGWQLAGRPGDATLIGDLAIIPPSALAAVACGRAAQAVAEDRRLVWGWRLIGLAALAYVGGEIVQLVYELSPGEYTFPSLADPLYLAFYPLFFAGIAKFTVARRTRSIRVGLDAMTIAIGGMAVVWYALLGPTAYSDTGGTLSTLVAFAYPVCDLIFVFALAGLLTDAPRGAERLPLLLLATGIVLFIAADLIYGHLVLNGLYSGGDPVDTLYVVAMLAFALAAATQRRVFGAQPDDEALRRRHLALVPYLALATVFGLLIATQWNDPFFPDVSLILAAAAVAGLIALRQIFAQRELVELHAELRAAHRELADLAATDPTTELSNQRALVAALDTELARRARNGRPCSLLFLDIDHFKSVNDTFGHAAGDTTLREFGAVVAAELRAVDIFGRWGGEEFIALLPGVGDADAALVAERIRAAVAGHSFGAVAAAPLTVSIGVSGDLQAGRETLLAEADKALYEAKRGGRDRVELWSRSDRAVGADAGPDLVRA